MRDQPTTAVGEVLSADEQDVIATSDAHAAAAAARVAEAFTSAGYPQLGGVAESDCEVPDLAAAAAAWQQDGVEGLSGTADYCAAQAGAGDALRRAEESDSAPASEK